jgi:hypothetical protein
MAYRDRLRRWVVVRLLPNMQRVEMGRFYHYSNADGYVRVLRRSCPDAQFVVMFDPSGGREFPENASIDC